MTPPRPSRILYNSWKLGKQLVGETACLSRVPLCCLVLNCTFNQRTEGRQPLTFEILCLLAGGRPASRWQLVPSICGPIQKTPFECWNYRALEFLPVSSATRPLRDPLDRDLKSKLQPTSGRRQLAEVLATRKLRRVFQLWTSSTSYQLRMGKLRVGLGLMLKPSQASSVQLDSSDQRRKQLTNCWDKKNWLGVTLCLPKPVGFCCRAKARRL